jgi:hypothetical protein
MPIFPTISTIFSALKKHITLALFILSLAASALFIYSWLDARRSAAQLAATLAAQQEIISAASDAQTARDAALTQSLAQIAALERQVQTPQQASAALAQSLPQFVDTTTGSPLPAPLQFIPFPSTNSSPANLSSSSTTSAPNSSPGNAQNSSAPQQGTTPSGNSSAQSQNSVVNLMPSSRQKDPAAPGTTNATSIVSSAAQNCSPGSPNPGTSTACPTTTNSSTSQQGRAAPGNPVPQPHSATPPSEPTAKAGALSYLKSQIANVRSLSPDSSPNSPPSTQPGQLAAHGNPSTSSTASQPQSSAEKCSPGSPNPATSAPCPPAAASTQQGTASPGNPDAPIPGSICIPPIDLKPLYDSIEDCEACAAKLTASQADLADETTKFNAASAQRDAAIKSAHGTFWSRAKTAAKWIAIGAAAGAVIAKYH